MAFGVARAGSLFLALGVGAGCASAPPSPPATASISTSESSGGDSADAGGSVPTVEEVALENDALHDRVDDLESRLSRLEEENEALRAALRESGRSVRISGVDPVREEPEITVESDTEADPEGEIDDRGSRPVLTLHGPPVVAVPPGLLESRPALAAAAPLGGPPAPAVALPPPAGSLGRLLVTGSPSDVPAIPAAPVTVLSSAPTETDAVALEYQAALRRLSERDLPGALLALQRFAEGHPSHPYADNALYFRGEIYYAQHAFREAIRELEHMVALYPTGGRVADALLRIGMCWERLGDSARAEQFFSRVRSEHPESSAARMADREDT